MEADAVGHAAALAEPEQRNAAGLSGVGVEGEVDEVADLGDGALEGVRVGFAGGAAEGVPAEAGVAGLDLERGLRADHEQPAAGQVGTEAEQVLTVGAVTVESNEGGEGSVAVAAGMRDGVDQGHAQLLRRSFDAAQYRRAVVAPR